jgi:hypothetical protein
MILLGVSVYLVVTFFLTFIGIERQNEGLKIFIISLLLTPVAGMFYMITKKKNYARINYFYCKRCDYIFPVRMKHCPCCVEEGEKVRLVRYQSPYKVKEVVEIADFA